MSKIDIDTYFKNMLIYITRNNGIQWTLSGSTPSLLDYRTENASLTAIETVTKAVEIVTSIEMKFQKDEFASMVLNFDRSAFDFTGFFNNSIEKCLNFNYSPFEFIRFLSYVIHFSIYCYKNGYIYAPDLAHRAIINMIHNKPHIFSDIHTWDRLFEEAEIINGPGFIHPHYPNHGCVPLRVVIP